MVEVQICYCYGNTNEICGNGNVICGETSGPAPLQCHNPKYAIPHGRFKFCDQRYRFGKYSVRAYVCTGYWWWGSRTEERVAVFKEYLGKEAYLSTADVRNDKIVDPYNLSTYDCVIKSGNVKSIEGARTRCATIVFERLDPYKIPKIEKIDAVLLRRQGYKDIVRVTIKFTEVPEDDRNTKFAFILVIYAPKVVHCSPYIIQFIDGRIDRGSIYGYEIVGYNYTLTLDVEIPAGQRDICIMIL